MAAFNVLNTSGKFVTIAAFGEGSTSLLVSVLSLYRRQITVIGCTTAAESQKMGRMLRELVSGFVSRQLTPPDEKSLTRLSFGQTKEAYEEEVKRAVVVFD